MKLWQQRGSKAEDMLRAYGAGFFVTLFAFMGMKFLGGSFAQTQHSSFNPADGVVSAPATIVADATSSTGKAIRFDGPTAAYSAATTAVPASITAGATNSYTAMFKSAAGVSNVIIDAEIYNSSDQRVFQYFQEGQNLTSTGSSYTWSWNPTTAGTYTLKLGIFTSGWQNTLIWNATAANLTVGQVATGPTQPPVVTPAGPSYAPWGDKPFYVDPNNPAVSYVKNNPGAAGVNLIAREGQTPIADWFGGWNTNVQSDADGYVTAATNAAAIPVLIAYNIPARDCGGFSAGGTQTKDAYITWITQMANGIGNRTAVVLVEPDALAGIDCLSAADQQARYDELSQAVTIFKSHPSTYVYLDAGHSGWQPASTIAQRLTSANIGKANGFALNISNFTTTADNTTYGNQVSALVGNQHYVIDTSRNGNGPSPDGQWCNPPGRALGTVPTTHTGNATTDALIWAKGPWGSDGPCNGGPDAGQEFWPYAIQLAQNAGW